MGGKRAEAEAKSRRARLAAIRRIVAETAVDSQERLIALLKREGFAAAQATLSRDLKSLGIGKAPSPSGGYTYAPSGAEPRPASETTFIQDFRRGFVSLEFSGSLGVIRTHPGHASSVASALDNLGMAEVLGTIAGDDTILVITTDGRRARALSRRLEGWARQ